MSQLDRGSIHLLRLTAKGQATISGWVTVSNTVLPLLLKLPSELIETKTDDSGNFARLTERGETVLKYL